jgi:putative redox protein
MPTTLTALAMVLDPRGGLRVDARTGTGFEADLRHDDSGVVDEPAEPHRIGPCGVAACTSMDVASILRKKRQPADSYRIAVTGQKTDEHPQVYTDIVIEHLVSGDVEPRALRRSVEPSATTYPCPVNAMLSHSVRIEHRYRLAQGHREEVSALVAVLGRREPRSSEGIIWRSLAAALCPANGVMVLPAPRPFVEMGPRCPPVVRSAAWHDQCGAARSSSVWSRSRSSCTWRPRAAPSASTSSMRRI